MVFLQVTDKFMNSPLQILLKEEEIALDGILQFHVSVQREDHKFSTLCDIYEVPVYIILSHNCQSTNSPDKQLCILQHFLCTDDLHLTVNYILQLTKEGM